MSPKEETLELILNAQYKIRDLYVSAVTDQPVETSHRLMDQALTNLAVATQKIQNQLRSQNRK